MNWNNLPIQGPNDHYANGPHEPYLRESLEMLAPTCTECDAPVQAYGLLCEPCKEDIAEQNTDTPLSALLEFAAMLWVFAVAFAFMVEVLR